VFSHCWACLALRQPGPVGLYVGIGAALEGPLGHRLCLPALFRMDQRRRDLAAVRFGGTLHCGGQVTSGKAPSPMSTRRRHSGAQDPGLGAGVLHPQAQAVDGPTACRPGFSERLTATAPMGFATFGMWSPIRPPIRSPKNV
jgi:hypothetical protein